MCKRGGLMTTLKGVDPLQRCRMDVRIVYLTLYNLFGLAGWGFILFTVLTMAGEGRLKRLWDEHEWTVKIVQGAAVLEIAHAGLGIVRQLLRRGCCAAAVLSRVPSASHVFTPVSWPRPGVFACRDCVGRAGPAVQVPVYALPQAQGLRAHA